MTSRLRSMLAPSRWARRARGSATCRPIFISGSRAVSGSWKTVAATAPRRRFSVRSGAPRTCVSPSVIEPVAVMAGRQEAYGGEGGQRLAGAGFADEAETLAGSEVEGKVGHQRLSGGGEGEVVDVEEGRHGSALHRRVIPAQAGTHDENCAGVALGPCFRRDDTCGCWVRGGQGHARPLRLGSKRSRRPSARRLTPMARETSARPGAMAPMGAV